jgi:ABC-type transporter Mla maintaining outer membrane lipid asymmetry ATPase subunit MlaF
MLYDGKILETGTPGEILRTTHPVLREFVETSGAVQFERGAPQ